MPSQVTLLVNGQLYGGWTEVDVRSSVECLAGTFELTLSEKWPGQAQAREIPVGARCAVRIDGETVITGWVDDVRPGYDDEHRSLTVSGRDATGDLVDCSAVHGGGQWSGQTLTQIAADLCRPFGIRVIAETDVGEPFGTWQIQEGETVNDNLQRAALQRGVLLYSNGLGDLIIGRASAKRVATVLELGVNIVSASGERSHRDRYSEYRIIGQQPMDDEAGFDTGATEVAAVAKDRAVGRYRPLVVVAEDNVQLGTAQQRADWERSTRAGAAVQVAYTVKGWRHAAGLWIPNRRVPVRDAWMRIEADLFIQAVNYRLSGGGETTILSLTLPAAYDRIPMPDPATEPLQ
jgi:prophage tail gpP-like protein